MVSRRLVLEIERNANKLAIDLVESLRNDGRAASYRNLSDAQYRGVVRDLFSNLGDWLESHAWNKLRKTYEAKGRERYHGGMPLEQLIYSLTKTKQLLIDFVQKSMPGDASERDQELQLIVAISEFFDRAVYHTVVGYEDGRTTQTSVRKAAPSSTARSKAKPAAKRARKKAPASDEMHISRGGDIGETSG